MRNILLITLFVSGLGFTIAENNLNGKWVPVRLVIDGADLPEAAYKNMQLSISDSIYVLDNGMIDKGIIKYAGNKIDLYGNDGPNIGKHITAIYKFENSLLTICYNLSGDKYPEDFETKGKAQYFVAVFKKAE